MKTTLGPKLPLLSLIVLLNLILHTTYSWAGINNAQLLNGYSDRDTIILNDEYMGEDQAQMMNLLNEPCLPNVPYKIPAIPADNYTKKVYIDPSSKTNGTGTMSSPHNTLNGITISSNTSYYIKRGTQLNERVSKKWTNNYITAYGTGNKPIIKGGLIIRGGSSNFVFRDLDIRAGRIEYGSTVHGVVQHETQEGSISDGVYAYCRIRGLDNGEGFPENAIRHATANFILFNNEISHANVNGFWLGTASNVRIVRNWFYKMNIKGETSTEGNGDIIQAIYRNDNLYIAGNVLDRSNSTWKYALMLRKKDAYASKNIVVEYNTLIDAKPGRGGAVLYWRPGGDPSILTTNNVFRKNVINTISYNGVTLRDASAIQSMDGEFQPSDVYGIRDNHIITGRTSGICYPSSLDSKLDKSNKIFNSHDKYASFLSANKSIGQYGSDIITSKFWESDCTQSIYDVTFSVKDNMGADLATAAKITFAGVTNTAGNYTFPGIAAGTYNYTVEATGYNTINASVTVDKNTTVNVVMTKTTAPTYTVNFNVTTGTGTAINNAVITFAGKTNPMGNYIFQDIIEGVYSYSIEATGYQTASVNNVSINKNSEFTVKLTASAPQTYTVVFQVANSLNDSNINDAVIKLGSITNEAGNYTFHNVPAGKHTFSVSATGYKNYSDVITDLMMNITVPVYLDPTGTNKIRINAKSQPAGAGFISGAGEYNVTESVRVAVEPVESDFIFVGWMENDKIISTSQNYTFTASDNREIVASFNHVPSYYNISTTIADRNAGTLYGDGRYAKGETVTVEMVVNSGYEFKGWANKSGQIVSRQNSYSFEVARDTALEAIVEKEQSITEQSPVSVYPNPGNGRLNVVNMWNDDINVRVINSYGQMVETRVLLASETFMDLTKLSPGFYFIHFEYQNEVVVEKVLFR
jgi:hypothetical protein